MKHSIAKHCPFTFRAFLESFRFEIPAGFCHDPRMRFANDRDLGVLCTDPFQVHEFIEHQGIFRLSDCTSVDLVVAYLARLQAITVYMSASGCVGWFSYSRHTSFDHPLEGYRATVCDHGESAARFPPAIAIVSLGRFIRDEDARPELRIYRGEYVRHESPGTPSEGRWELRCSLRW